MPMVDRLKPGQRLLLVIPTLLPDTPLYLKLVDHDSNSWSRALYLDRELKLLMVTSESSNASGLPVRAALYEKR
jgi:hypothetical protein